MSQQFRSPLLMDDDAAYLGNSAGIDGRGRLHVKVSNNVSEKVPISAEALPLPNGASTYEAQTNGSQKTQIVANGQSIGRLDDALKVALMENVADGSHSPTFTAVAFNVTADSNPTDVFVLRGSATKKIRIIDLQITALQNSTGYIPIQGDIRSTDNIGGTYTVLPCVKHESTDAVTTAEARAYTANPTTLGTLVGSVYSLFALIPSDSPTGRENIAPIDIIHALGKPITLTGVNEIFAINFNATSAPGLRFIINISWYEE